MTMRYKLALGGDVPPVTAARRMGLSLAAFRKALPKLVSRGFPQADETTGNFDLDAIDAWRHGPHPHLSPDRLNLSNEPARPPLTAPDEDIRQKIIAGLTPAKKP